MTALPELAGETLTLVCDGCGQIVAGISSGIRDWAVVWALVAGYGWSGSPLAIGPHRCPRCGVGPTGRAVEPAAVEPAASEIAFPHRPEPPQPWRVPSWSVGEAVVVRLHGELDVSVVDDLRETLRQAGEGHPHLVLDLTEVRLIDSAVLALLVHSHQAARQRGGAVILAAPSPFVVTVLRAMRLLGVFPMFGDGDQALRWLAVRRR
jgi:anti-anti-sigma factor